MAEFPQTKNLNDFLATSNGLDPQTVFVENDLTMFNSEDGQLSGFNLSYARLDETNLKRANLSDVNLTGANLTNADLSNANLTGANLTSANFQDADLTGADLTNANLTNVNFMGANLQDTNLTQALLKNVNFENAKSLTSNLQSERTVSKTAISDSQMEKLVREFLSHTPDTPAGKRATYKLLQTIQQLPKLVRSYQPLRGYCYQDFEEILNDTLLKILKEISSFKPETTNYVNSLTHWINYQLRLYYKPKDRLREARRHNIFSLDRYISDKENTTFLDLLEDNHSEATLNTIDSLIEQAQQQRRQRLGLEVWQYLQEDPKNRLKNCYSTKCSECNCHWLLQKRELSDPPVPWQAIADDLGIPYGTITAHWHKKCKPLLSQIAQEIEQKLQEEI
ncbi:MAG: pentapeptide repeat-containing protein [Microcystis sp. LE19-84.1B]|jgi:DNA-directed RNA polymerase specialized sigma24 family protein|uniref:pentapeptide repeat-containing protein n=1 Tax=Microcystis sp. LE19-84.1B TaxID=3016438 RepID=UPI0022C99AE8|nr:pentapeptide repeat-containing protein [Microcystis sp. LE19-84.1B]MCZ8223669.1 pentapeptide repeat-containing protein [Microcystis sp. LE19-84.1B]